MTVVDGAGDSVDLEVVALLENSIDVALAGSFVAQETFDDLVGDTAPTVAFIDVASGAQSDTQDDIERARPTAGPTSRSPRATPSPGSSGTIFDFVINAVNGLLLMSVLVALIGIVNTLSLSILERRRELGLLRVVGMVDKRVQRMVQLESVLIAALGTLQRDRPRHLHRLGDHPVDRPPVGGDASRSASPPDQLLLVLVLGVVLGVVASYIPSRRSTRLEVLDAIQST